MQMEKKSSETQKPIAFMHEESSRNLDDLKVWYVASLAAKYNSPYMLKNSSNFDFEMVDLRALIFIMKIKKFWIVLTYQK